MFGFFKQKPVARVEYDRSNGEYSKFVNMDVETAIEVHKHWMACLYGAQTFKGAAKILNISNSDRVHRIGFRAFQKLLKEGLVGNKEVTDMFVESYKEENA